MATMRQLTRREVFMGLLLVGIISSGTIGGAMLRDDQQMKNARDTFASLPPNEQLVRLEEAREALLKKQMILERKLDEAREQRRLKERGEEIRTTGGSIKEQQASMRALPATSPVERKESVSELHGQPSTQNQDKKTWGRWVGWS